MRSAAVALLLLATRVFAAGRELAPAPLVAAPHVRSRPFVAEAGGRFLTVWFEDRGFNVGTPILGALTGGNGTPVGTTFPLPALDPWSASAFEVVGTGDSFAIIQTSARTVTRLVDVSLDGRVLGTRTLALPPHDGLRAAWNGTHFLVALTEQGEPAAAMLLSRSGEVVQSGITLLGTVVREVVAAKDSFVVLTSNGGKAYLNAVAENGGVRMETLDGASPQMTGAALPNGNVLLAWAQSNDPRILETRVWQNGTLGAVRTAHSGTARVHPLHIVAGSTGHLIAFVHGVGGASVLATVPVRNDGTPRAVMTATAIIADADSSGSASNEDGLFIAFHAQGRILGASIERTGFVHAPSVLTVQPADQYRPILATDGASRVAAWTETTASGTRVRTAHIAPGLAVERIHEVLPAGRLASEDLAWNGSEYLAVVWTSAGLHALRIAANGAPAAGPLAQLTSLTPDDAAAVWAGDRWAVAWSHAGTIHFATVGADGTVSVPHDLRMAHPIRGLSLAFGSSDLHLTWIEARPLVGWGPVGTHVFTMRVGLDGTPMTAPVAIPAWQPMAIASAANADALLVLIDESGRTTVTSLGASGTASTRTLFDWRGQSDIAWTGTDFVAAIRSHGSQWYVSVFHLDEDGALTTPPRGTTTLPAQHTGPPSVAGTPLDTVVALQEIGTSSPRAVLYAEDEMALLPDRPPAPRNLRLEDNSAGTHDLVWDDVAEYYLIERIDAEGRVFTAYLAPEARWESARGTVRIRSFENGVPSASTVWFALQPRSRGTRRH